LAVSLGTIRPIWGSQVEVIGVILVYVAIGEPIGFSVAKNKCLNILNVEDFPTDFDNSVFILSVGAISDIADRVF